VPRFFRHPHTGLEQVLNAKCRRTGVSSVKEGAQLETTYATRLLADAPSGDQASAVLSAPPLRREHNSVPGIRFGLVGSIGSVCTGRWRLCRVRQPNGSFSGSRSHIGGLCEKTIPQRERVVRTLGQAALNHSAVKPRKCATHFIVFKRIENTVYSYTLLRKIPVASQASLWRLQTTSLVQPIE